MSVIEGDVLLGFADFFEDGVSETESGAHGQADGISVGATMPVRRPVAPARAPAKPSKGMPTTAALKALQGKIKPRKAGASKTVSPHKAALANAAMAGKNAVSVANNAAKGVMTYQKNLAAGKHAPAVPLTKIGYNEYGGIVLGVANKKVAKTLTPMQRMAVQKQASAAARLSAANKALKAAAVNAKKKGQAALAFVQKAIPVVKKALVVKPIGGKTAVGAVAQFINERGGINRLTNDEVIGLTEILADGISGEQTEIGQDGQSHGYDDGPDFIGQDGISGELTEIGYLEEGYEGRSGFQDEIGVDLPNAPAGMPAVPFDDPTYTYANDPMASSTTTAPLPTDPSLMTDPGSGPVLAPDGSTIYDPTTDPAVIPMPVRGQDLTQDELMAVWDHVPDDGFVYGESEGGKHYPPNSVGSVNTFTGSNKNANGWAPGLIFGGEDWLGPSPDNPNTFWHSNWPSTLAIQSRSLDLGWGPLVGNPQGQLKNMQYAQADKKWFWQGKSAPVAYSAEADAKIAQANQATIAANRAAAVAQAKQMQADQAAQAEAQANQDAANALAESAASSQMNVAAAQQTTQQGQLDLQTQQQQLADAASQSQMAQQASQVQTQAQQAMIQQAQQQAKTQAAAQQALIDQASVYNQWAAAHPDEAVAQMQAEDLQAQMQGGGGGDDGGDGGDDGSDDGGDDGQSDDDILSQHMDADAGADFDE